MGAVDVSVVIATYRRERLLLEAIASVCSQPGVVLEVIVVDDSPEGTAEAGVRSFADPRVRYVHRSTPSGGHPGAVRNDGVAVARAPLLHFLDDDDRLVDGVPSRPRGRDHVRAVPPWPSAASFPSGTTRRSAIKSSGYFQRVAAASKRIRGRRWFAAQVLFREMPFVNSACMVRRDVFNAFRGLRRRPPRLTRTSTFICVSGAGGFQFVDRDVLHYRVGAPSIMNEFRRTAGVADGDICPTATARSTALQADHGLARIPRVADYRAHPAAAGKSPASAPAREGDVSDGVKSAIRLRRDRQRGERRHACVWPREEGRQGTPRRAGGFRQAAGGSRSGRHENWIRPIRVRPLGFVALRGRPDEVLRVGPLPPTRDRTSRRRAWRRASPPAGRSATADIEPYYGAAERIYAVHGSSDGDPTEPGRTAPIPTLRFPHQGFARTLASVSRRMAFRWGISREVSITGMGASASSAATCDGYYCRLDAKMDAEIACIRPAVGTGNVQLVTETECLQVLVSPEGKRATGVRLRRGSASIRRPRRLRRGLRGPHGDAAPPPAVAHDGQPPGASGTTTGASGGTCAATRSPRPFLVMGLQPLPPMHTKTFAINSFYGPTEEWPYPQGVIQMAGQLPTLRSAGLRPRARGPQPRLLLHGRGAVDRETWAHLRRVTR